MNKFKRDVLVAILSAGLGLCAFLAYSTGKSAGKLELIEEMTKIAENTTENT